GLVRLGNPIASGSSGGTDDLSDASEAGTWSTMTPVSASSFQRELVDLVGIEPTTSSMPWKRAPSCATGPLFAVRNAAHKDRVSFILSQPHSLVKQLPVVSCHSQLSVVVCDD